MRFRDGLMGLVLGGAFAFGLTGKAGAGIEDGMVAHWKMEDRTGDTAGNTIPDSSGNGNDLTIFGSPTFDGERVVFDDDGYLTAADSDELDLLGDWSVSYWAKENSYSNPAAWMLKFKGNVPSGGWFVNSSDDISISSAFYGPSAETFIIDNPFELSKWYRVTTTFDSVDSIFRMYLGNELEHESIGSGFSVSDSSNPLIVGGGPVGDEYVSRLNGEMKDIRIYDRALSEGEVGMLVPESSTLGVFGVGLAGLLGYRGRRK
jgi:hypothetical protein